MFRVEITGEYGTDEGGVYLYDGDTEIMSWVSDEWVDDPSVVYGITNAIRIGYELGPEALRNLTERE